MNSQKRSEYTTRYQILKLLSDAEVTRVGSVATSLVMVLGDEYIDLSALHHGVRRTLGNAPLFLGRILPRKAVTEDTWSRILVILAPHAEALMN